MNKGIKIISVLFIMIFMVCSYFLLKSHYEQHRYDINKLSYRKTTDYGSVLRGCFESNNWNNLPLSKNFREKYKTKFDITEFAGNFVGYDDGLTRENGEKLIIIGYLKEALFDFSDTKSVQYDLYFKYKVDEEGLLDDVEFVRVEKRDPMTGRIIES